jgi:hypothetical protein
MKQKFHAEVPPGLVKQAEKLITADQELALAA